MQIRNSGYANMTSILTYERQVYEKDKIKLDKIRKIIFSGLTKFPKNRHNMRTAGLKLASSYRSKQKEKNEVQKDLIPVLYDNMHSVCELLFNFTLYSKTGSSVGGTRMT